MNKRIIDRRKKEKYMVDDAYLNGMAKLCGWQGTIVYNSLCRHSSKDQTCFPSIKLMAEQHGVHRETIIKGIKKLEQRKVITVQKKRTKAGVWLNNSYTLLDKSEWDYTQVDETDTAIQVGVTDTPSRCDRHSQVGETDTKETHIKETHRRKHITSDKSQDIADIIKQMEKIDPKNKLYYGNTTQRKACQFLLDEYGKEQTEKAIEFYIYARQNRVEYLPTVTTPHQLVDKWQSLLQLIERKQAEKKKSLNNFVG